MTSVESSTTLSSLFALLIYLLQQYLANYVDFNDLHGCAGIEFTGDQARVKFT